MTDGLNTLLVRTDPQPPTAKSVPTYVYEEPWATSWMIGVLGFDSRRELGIFPFTTASKTAPGPTQPPIQWVPRALSLRVNLHSPIRLHGMVLS
jgi:hypothetical protein